MNQHKDIIVLTKYLWFANGILRRIACFRPKNTKPLARLARTHSFILFFLSSFRLVGIVIKYSLRNKSTNTRIIVPTKYVIFYQQDNYWLIEKKYMFPTPNYQNFGSLAPLARNNLWVFQVSGFLVAINRHEREYISSVTNTRTFTNKILRRIVCFRGKHIFWSLAIIYSFFLSFRSYCTDKNMLFTNKTMRRIACFQRNAKSTYILARLQSFMGFSRVSGLFCVGFFVVGRYI